MDPPHDHWYLCTTTLTLGTISTICTHTQCLSGVMALQLILLHVIWVNRVSFRMEQMQQLQS